ncbi:alpha/beta hydrolase [Gilvimarinus agarilyticus]|uniref:alpha/beta hydrolase n=1 Tax=Gilvimarinus agarilyticus TaxID=679259 RepID=UPI0006987585|nr:alpha/beta hydrolase-fold protein [Gilvimarinus agarilyticus]
MKALWWSISLVWVLTACGGGGSASGGSGGNLSGGAQESPEAVAAQSSSSAASAPTLVEFEENVSYSFLSGEVAPPHIISSVITGIDYPVHVYLPPNYAESDKKYPVVYALDGQWQFPGLPYLMEQAGGEAILVAISQGPDDRRRTDYLLPGARSYFQFLTAELMPLIEPMYRVDTQNRTLVGTSFGGVFTTIAMLLDDVSAPYFTNYLAFDASLYEHQALTRALLDQRYQASGELSANYFASSALPAGNDTFVSEFVGQLRRKNFSSLTIIQRDYQVTHAQVAEPSFTEAVSLLLTP